MDVIQVKDVTKKFRIYYDKGATLKEKVIFRNRNKYEDRWVLKGINLNIKKGETVGLIGENGSGKSTLLKLLSRIIYPNSGEIKINGKVSSLLELGAGFHPDMTGKENIYMNASIFGLTKAQIDDRLDDIIAFSELEEFMDNPVRTYSSGMYMRLAFSVAINVEADILLIDEILAVGDASFQKKCFDKILELKQKGITIVFVSHDLGAVERLCDRVIWLENGNIDINGKGKYVIDKYLLYMSEKDEKRTKVINQNVKSHEENNKTAEDEKVKSKPLPIHDSQNRWGSGEAVIRTVKIFNSELQTKTLLISGQKYTISIEYKILNEDIISNIVFGIAIFTSSGTHCYGTNTSIDNIKLKNINKEGTIKFGIEELNLINGNYYLNVAIHDLNGKQYDYLEKCYQFEVYSTNKDVGICRLPHKWVDL